MVVLDVRLPRDLRPAQGAVARRAVRDREGRGPHRRDRAHRPRRPDRAADRRQPRLAALPQRVGAAGHAAQRARVPRPGGPPPGSDEDLELWLDPKYVEAGYAWNFPAGDELRIGVGSFDPHKHVKRQTVELAQELEKPADRWQGNWIPHQMRAPTDGIVFFAGDSAGHCFPVTAEGIRPALYFGLAAGRELRKVVEGRQTRAQALDRYAAFCDEHLWAFRWLLRTQHLVGRTNRYPILDTVLDVMDRDRVIHWAFNHYLDIAPPSYALEGPHGDRFVTPLGSAPAAPPVVAAA
ncbi:hypothetical protein [Conexibacter sp. W3-3-2]|uniref:hypothetical protein n=1 Tax=Conexibacter sp. W3-3-2 TaxID=2675227 RepID=UPI001E5EA542|nr:hypothetical protein [Conexibacter sp. W3-3-2]